MDSFVESTLPVREYRPETSPPVAGRRDVVIGQILMHHDPREGIEAATRVLDALYDREPRAIKAADMILRLFAQNDAERAMPPDE